MSLPLVLHFDINGTITPVDTTEPGTKEQNANMVIAKSVYGKVNNEVWTLNDDPYEETDSITYYDYLKSINFTINTFSNYHICILFFCSWFCRINWCNCTVDIEM